MKRKKISLLIFVVAILINLVACETKPDYSLPEQEFSSGHISDNLNSNEDSKEEFDSENAYEYAKLESILQELKRQTDDTE